MSIWFDGCVSIGVCLDGVYVFEVVIKGSFGFPMAFLVFVIVIINNNLRCCDCSIMLSRGSLLLEFNLLVFLFNERVKYEQC